MVKNIYYFNLLMQFVFSSRYNIHRKHRTYIDRDDEFRYENSQSDQTFNDHKETSVNISFKSPSRETRKPSYPRNESFNYEYMYANRHESHNKQFSFSQDVRDFHYTARSDIRSGKSFEYEEHSTIKQRNRYFPYNRPRAYHITPVSDSEQVNFSTSRDDFFNYRLEKDQNERYDRFYDTNLDDYVRFEECDSYMNNNFSNTLPESECDHPIYMRPCIKDETSARPYNYIRYQEENESRIISIEPSSNIDLYVSKIKSLSKMIDTHGKIYAVFENSLTEYIGFSDIQLFIQGDFSINGYFLYTDLIEFLDLIDHVAENENIFWSQNDSEVMIKYLAEKMNKFVMKYDFCKLCSPLLSYFHSIINIKYFIRNILLEDIKLARNSCLFILLLKAVESLCNVQQNEVVRYTRNDGEVMSEKYKDFDVYSGDKGAILVLKELHEVFYKIARKIFQCTKISENYIIMLDFIYTNVRFRNKDVHLSRNGWICFGRVISDCIFRMNPKRIVMLISHLRTLEISSFNKAFSLDSISDFFLKLYKSPSKLDNKIQHDFRFIYENLIDSYIDLFKNELSSLVVFRDRNSLVKNEVKYIDLIFQKSRNKEIFLERLELKNLIELSHELCVIFNHIMKVGLNYEFYSKKYIEISISDCNDRIKAVLETL